jgi:hypothetical protein
LKKLLFKILKTVLPLLLGVYLIWYFFHSMSEESWIYFKKSLWQANYFWILISLILSFVAVLSRAYRWKYTLEPLGHKTSFWNRYHALMIGYLINLTIPRAGEASRAAILMKSEKVPFSKSFGTILAERVVDLIMLATVTGITFLVAYDYFDVILTKIKSNFSPETKSEKFIFYKNLIYFLVLITFMIFTFLLFHNEKLRGKVLDFIKNLISGVFSIFKSKSPFAFIGHTFLIWSLYIVYFALPFLALEESKNIPIEGILLAFIAGSVGISFTNGGIGTFPLLVALVVVVFLPDNSNAQAVGNALGMIIWVSQTLLMIILGLISLWLAPKKYNKLEIKENE